MIVDWIHFYFLPYSSTYDYIVIEFELLCPSVFSFSSESSNHLNSMSSIDSMLNCSAASMRMLLNELWNMKSPTKTPFHCNAINFDVGFRWIIADVLFSTIENYKNRLRLMVTTATYVFFFSLPLFLESLVESFWMPKKLWRWTMNPIQS